MKALLLGLSLLLVACSNLTPLEEVYSKSKAHHGAFAAEGFTFDRPMPHHPKEDLEFYYKNCSLKGRNPYPLKSEYECSEPY